MTLDEAIKILSQDLGADTYEKYPGLYLAQKLGIKALEQVEHIRITKGGGWARRLPGETKEEEVREP